MLTKKDLTQIQIMINQTFEVKFDEKFEEVRLFFSNEMLQFKDDILSELKNIRMDFEVMRGRLYDHEDRIQHLESSSHDHQKTQV